MLMYSCRSLHSQSQSLYGTNGLGMGAAGPAGQPLGETCGQRLGWQQTFLQGGQQCENS